MKDEEITGCYTFLTKLFAPAINITLQHLLGKSMNPNHEDLLQRLGALREEFSELGLWLCEAGQELQRHGALPPPDLPEELAATRLNFLNFRLELFKWIQSLRLPSTTSILEPGSLQNCEELLQATVKAARERDKAEAMRQQSLEVLRRATLLAYAKQSDFPPLQALQAAVRELQHGIAEAEIFDLPPDCQALAEDTHPIAVLLTLIENQNEAQNNLWITLLKTVQASLDAGLLDAVKNGELLLRAEISSNGPQEKDKPAVRKTAASSSRQTSAKPAAPAIITPASFQPAEDEPPPVEQEIAAKPVSSPSEIIVQLATAILDTPVAERGALIQDLTWRLLLEDELNLAYYLTRGAEQQNFILPPHLPSWLMRALALSRHLRRADGEIARLLQDDFAQGHNDWGASAYPRDGQNAAPLLLAAACMRPALLDLASAARLLRSLELEGMEQFCSYTQRLIRIGAGQQLLNQQTFKKINDRAAWPGGTKALSQETEQPQQAEKNWQDIGSHRDAVLHELQACASRDDSLPLAASLEVCRRAVENVGALLDPEAELPADEPDPKSLLHAGFWKASALVHESGNLQMAGPNIMLESVLNFLAGREEEIILPKPQAQPAIHDRTPGSAPPEKVLPAKTQRKVIKRDQDLAEADAGKAGIFDDFFPKTFRLLWEYLEPPSSQNKPRIFEIVNNIRKFTKGLTQNCAIGPVNIPAAHAEEVAELLEIWFRAEKARRISEGPVQQLWNSLGFDTTKITKHSLGNRTWFDVITSPLLDNARCPVPAYGSGAAGFYRIICVWPPPHEPHNHEIELIHHTDDTPAGTAVIFFYFGGLAEEQRRHLGQLCHEHRRTFIVLDTLLLLYLHSQPKSHWLPAMFQCTLPFTFLETQ